MLVTTLTSLQTLQLSRNRISDFPSGMSALTSLTQLDLIGNGFTFFPFAKRKRLTNSDNNIPTTASTNSEGEEPKLAEEPIPPPTPTNSKGEQQRVPEKAAHHSLALRGASKHLIESAGAQRSPRTMARAHLHDRGRSSEPGTRKRQKEAEGDKDDEEMNGVVCVHSNSNGKPKQGKSKLAQSKEKGVPASKKHPHHHPQQNEHSKEGSKERDKEPGMEEEEERPPDESEKERKEAMRRQHPQHHQKKKKRRVARSVQCEDEVKGIDEITTPRGRERRSYRDLPRMIEERTLEEEETEFFAGMVNLVSFSLSGNMLTGVSGRMSELRSLRKLDLSKNNITELAEEVWMLPLLEWCDLSQNKLTSLSIPKGILSKSSSNHKS